MLGNNIICAFFRIAKMGTINDGFVPYPNARSITALCNPYTECDLQASKKTNTKKTTRKKMMSESEVESSMSSHGGSSETFEEDTDETFHVNDTYDNGNFNPYSTLDFFHTRKKKTTELPSTAPEYEDLTLYQEMASYDKNAKKERVYSLPDINVNQSAKLGDTKFNRACSLPDNAMKTRDKCIENSSTIAIVHNGGCATISGKKENLLYEKTKVIKTNSLTYSTTRRNSASKTKISSYSSRTRSRNNARLNRCFCALNVIFAVIALAALILGIVVLCQQQSLADKGKIFKIGIFSE